MPYPLDLTGLQVTDGRERASDQNRRQRGGEDETRRITTHIVDECGRTGDVAAHDTEGLGQRALNHGWTMEHAITLGDTGAARSVKPDRVDLVEIGNGAVAVSDIA